MVLKVLLERSSHPLTRSFRIHLRFATHRPSVKNNIFTFLISKPSQTSTSVGGRYGDEACPN